jgi:hypothetical protein
MNIISINREVIETALYEELEDDTELKDALDYFKSYNDVKFKELMYIVDDLFIDRIVELRCDMINEFVRLLEMRAKKETKNETS